MQGASLELVHVADVVAGFFQFKRKTLVKNIDNDVSFVIEICLKVHSEICTSCCTDQGVEKFCFMGTTFN